MTRRPAILTGFVIIDDPNDTGEQNDYYRKRNELKRQSYVSDTKFKIKEQTNDNCAQPSANTGCLPGQKEKAFDSILLF